MKLTPIAENVLKKRYLLRDEEGNILETPKDMIKRVAAVVASAEFNYGASNSQIHELAVKYYDMIDNQDFMPNSPTFTGAGTPLGQLSACFVLPIDDSLESIFETMKQAALIHQTGGGTGFAFSRLRPAGSVVRRSKGVASGPVSFLKVYNAATEAIKQGGTRRGANMGILRVDHPDIVEFITSKQDTTQLTNFNISVGITDAFMAALEAGKEYALIDPHTRKITKWMSAQYIWDLLVECAHNTGEPGIIFLDRINRRNPNNHVEEIEATNPCGEQPLPPYGSCNLGSINLSRFVLDPYTNHARIDWVRLRKITHLATMFLDNVIDVNKYPLPQLEEKARRDRRIGLGIMGWHEMLVQLMIPYDDPRAFEVGRQVMSNIKRYALEMSQQLAEERGVYPEWYGSQWQKAGIRVRNATLTTIAPTGTISIIAATPDMPVSGGVEPKFALVFTRNQADMKMLDVDGQFASIARREGWYSDELMQKIADNHGSPLGIDGVPEHWQQIFKVAHDISPEAHIRMQSAFQGEDYLDVVEQPVDAACSKTINFPAWASKDDVAKGYMLAWKLGLKGLTVYRDGSRENQVLTTGDKTKETITVETKQNDPHEDGICPEGGVIKREGGCISCTCGWSVCHIS